MFMHFSIKSATTRKKDSLHTNIQNASPIDFDIAAFFEAAACKRLLLTPEQ
jgi:hypothetical protein